jgi:hypothetical protein
MTEVRSADLCWGQRYHWLRYQQIPEGARHDAHIVGALPLPEGVSVRDVQATVNYLVRRYEVLRTVYDANARPWPQQRVQPPGALPLALVTTEQDGTPAPADAIRELTTAEFDLTRDWPVRGAVVTTGGVPKRVVMVFNHVGFDDWSMETFRREFETVLAATSTRRRAALPPATSQPADLAHHESARPAAVTGAAMEHWRTQLAQVPADIFARRRAVVGEGQAAGPEAYSASLVSPALLPAARDIAARHQVWPSAVHMAAYTVAMAAFTGEEVITPRWMMSHRGAGEHLSVMTCMFSPTLVAVDVSGATGFGEVVRRTAAAIDLAREHAHVPYDEIVELAAHEGLRRGRPVTAGSEVNFLSHPDQSCGTRRDRLTWNATPVEWARSGTDTYARVYEWSDGVTIGLQATTDVMPQDDIERFLRGYARLLVASQDQNTDLTLTEAYALFDFPPLRESRVLRIGPDAVDAEACEALLRTHPAVRTAHVSQDPRGLVADIELEPGPDATLTPASLRVFALGVIDQHPSAACPAWFRITTSPDAPLSEGDGRAPIPSDFEAARTLAKVVAQVNELDHEVNLALSYIAAGGRVLRLPRVLTELREAGWTGASITALSGIRPLLAVAASLSPSLGAGEEPGGHVLVGRQGRAEDGLAGRLADCGQ